MFRRRPPSVRCGEGWFVSALCGFVRPARMPPSEQDDDGIRRTNRFRTSKAGRSGRKFARSWQSAGSRGKRWPNRPSSACLPSRRCWADAARSRSPPRCGWSRRSASPAPECPRAGVASGRERRRARQSRLLFASRGDVARRPLHHAAAVVRRQGRDLRLSHRDRLGAEGRRRWCFARASAPTRPTSTPARSRCRINPASSISSSTSTASIASSRCPGRPSTARCVVSSRRCALVPARRLTPVAAPIAVPAQNIESPSVRTDSTRQHSLQAVPEHLRRTVEESFALLLPA